MRGRRIRVRTRAARSVRLSFGLLALALVLYLLSAVYGGEPSPPAEPPEARQQISEIALQPLSAFLIQLHSGDSAEAARIEAARYIRRGAAGYIMPEGGSHSVIGAMYFVRADADAVALRLVEKEQLAAQVLERGAVGVRLRITATAAQIGAFMAAEQSLRSLTDRLAALAVQLDQSATTPEAAARQIGLIHAESALRHRALTEAVGEDENPLMAELTALCKSLCDDTGEGLFAAGESPLSFSSKIKYNSISMRLAHIAFMQKLAT